MLVPKVGRVEEAARGGLRNGHSETGKRGRETNGTVVPRSQEWWAAPATSTGASLRLAGFQKTETRRVECRVEPQPEFLSHKEACVLPKWVMGGMTETVPIKAQAEPESQTVRWHGTSGHPGLVS